MKKIDESITKLKQRGQTFFASRKKGQLNQIDEKISAFDSYTIKANSTYAFFDLDKVDNYEAINEAVLPKLIKIGDLSALNFKKLEMNKKLPFLIPFSENKATTIFLDGENSQMVHTLFQTIAFRVMLSVSPDLVRYHLIDVNFGRDFSVLSNIKNKIITRKVIAKPNDINKTINELSDKIITANQSFLAKHPNIVEYNKTAGSMAVPYDFVFISNFPNGFSAEAIDNLFNLINNFNATQAGIYIFISYNKKINIPHGADLNKIFNITTNIYKENDLYKIENIGSINSDNSRYAVSLDSDFPKNLSKIISSINSLKQKTLILTFEKYLDNLIQTKNVWSKDATYGLKVPIGYINQNELHNFKLGKDHKSDNIDIDDYHALIGGISGFGKTILLHNIIINTAMQYSPLDVNFYLVDCKNGMAFNPYKNLPHTKIISTSNEREYAKSILENLTEIEFKNRARLFKENNSHNFISYNLQSKNKLPRIVFIIDEFQVLLENNDITSSHIEDLLVKVTKEGRAYGVNLILCTQEVSSLVFNMSNLKRRYAFSLGNMESERILGNNGATLLNRKGSAIMNNTQHGSVEANINFQVAYLDEKKHLNHYISFLDNHFKTNYPKVKINKFISDGEIGANVIKNNELTTNILHNSFKTNDNFCDIFVGEPSFVRNQHSFFKIRKQSKSNLLIVGNDMSSAISILGLSMYQLIKQSSKTSRFYIIDLFNIDNKYHGKLDFLKSISDNVHTVNANTLPDLLKDIEAEISKRNEEQKSGKITEGRIVLVFAYFREVDCFLKAPGEFVEPEAKNQLYTIFKKGPDYGIHSLLYALNHSTLLEVFDYSTIDDFENRIALYQGDSLRIIKDDAGSYPKEKGLGLIEAPDGVTSYTADIFKIYSEISIPTDHDDNQEIKLLKQLF